MTEIEMNPGILLLIVVLALISVYLIVRFTSAAYFQSKADYEERKYQNDGKKL